MKTLRQVFAKYELKGVISIQKLFNRIRSYPTRNWTTLWKFTLIGGATMAAQIALQVVESHRGLNLYYFSPTQGLILANLGMAVNKKWTFRERNLSWAWAILLWNLQSIPHRAAYNALWASLMQVPPLPYWGATILTTLALGGFSFVLTNEGVKGSLFFDQLLFVLTFYMVAMKMQFQPARQVLVKTETV